MKMIVVVFALVAVTIAAPPATPETAQVLRSEFNQNPDGAYKFSFETDNGISRQENGEVKEAFDEDKKPHPVVVVRGSWTYTDPEGKVETINYFADEYGFRAEGPSIPKGPASRR